MKCLFACVLLAAFAQAQSTLNGVSVNQNDARQGTPGRANLLREFDSSLEQVVSMVSPTVVQILGSGYGPAETHGHTNTARIARQHAIGSGVIVDPNGYVITNAHVVEGAQHVRVVVSPAVSSQRVEASPHQTPQIFDAKIVGRHKTADLAVLKIETTHLPFISLRNDLRVRQGELVFAVGSPEGLRDSVTMGIVSSVAHGRQIRTVRCSTFKPTHHSIQETVAVRWLIQTEMLSASMRLCLARVAEVKDWALQFQPRS